MQNMSDVRARVLENYYNYDDGMPLTCAGCGWSGSAKEGGSEYYRDLFDVSCPKCLTMLLVVPFPTHEQTKAAAAAGNEKAKAELPSVEWREAFFGNFERVKLKSPDELPDIRGDQKLDFIWDSETDEMKPGNVVIVCNNVVIWREPELYEGWSRFTEVKNIIKEKYGTRFKSLTPSDRACLCLYGDDLGAPNKITFS